MKKTTQSQSKQILAKNTQLNNPKTVKPQPQHSKKPTQQFIARSQIRTVSNNSYSQAKVYAFPNNQFIRNDYNQYSPEQVHGTSIYQQREGLSKQSIVLLRERLKNIREYYELMIQDERARNSEKSEVILGLVDEIQTTHFQKMQQIRKMIQQADEQKRQVGFVDDKMNEIKGNIDELINQSNGLKVRNSQLEKKIQEKSRVNKQKEREMEEVSQELLEVRSQLEQFQIVNLKNNKINREIQEIFKSASTIEST